MIVEALLFVVFVVEVILFLYLAFGTVYIFLFSLAGLFGYKQRKLAE